MGGGLPAGDRELTRLADRGAGFGLCLYNAGMDPHEDCQLGGRSGITTVTLSDREHLVFDWCRQRGMPVAFTLAGGYNGGRLTKLELVALHRMTIEETARLGPA